MISRTQLIQTLESARSHMEAIVASIDPALPIYTPWKIKEVLDHIAGWDDAIIASLSAHMAGEIPATPAKLGIDHYNAQTVSTRETIDYDHSLREWRATRQLLLKQLAELPEEKLAQPFILPWGPRGTIAEVVEIFAEHESQHAEEIQAIVDSLP